MGALNLVHVGGALNLQGGGVGGRGKAGVGRVRRAEGVDGGVVLLLLDLQGGRELRQAGGRLLAKTLQNRPIPPTPQLSCVGAC